MKNTNAQQNETATVKRDGKKIASLVLNGILLGILVILILIVGWLCIDKFIIGSPAPSLFGYSTFIVSTGSMSGTIEEGDVVIVKKTIDNPDYKFSTGDIITFYPDGFGKTPTTHRIIQFTDDGNFITKGDANDSKDTVIVTREIVWGEVVGVVPHVGVFLEWIKIGGGWMFLIALVLIVGGGIYLWKNPSIFGTVQQEVDGADDVDVEATDVATGNVENSDAEQTNDKSDSDSDNN